MVRRSARASRGVALPGGLDEVRESLAATLAIAVAGIEGGLFPRWPDRACAYCDASASCGVDRIAFAAKRHDPRLRGLMRFKEPAGADPGGLVVTDVRKPVDDVLVLADERPPIDADVRRRVATELDTTFLVEAGAGTGKTRVLVDRYIACLSGADAPPISAVVAITFTEKAAGELRQRIRGRLERILSGDAQSAPLRERLSLALSGLDDAPDLDHPRLRRPAAARAAGRGGCRSLLRAARPGRVGAASRASLARLVVGAARHRPAGGRQRRGR